MWDQQSKATINVHGKERKIKEYCGDLKDTVADRESRSPRMSAQHEDLVVNSIRSDAYHVHLKRASVSGCDETRLRTESLAT